MQKYAFIYYEHKYQRDKDAVVVALSLFRYTKKDTADGALFLKYLFFCVGWSVNGVRGFDAVIKIS